MLGMSEKQGVSYGAIALGVLAVGGIYWFATRKSEDVVPGAQSLTGPTPDAAPLSLQTEPIPTVAAPSGGGQNASGGGQNASFADGSLPDLSALPNINALPWGALLPLPGADTSQGAQESYADKFLSAPLYQYDPWHPGSYVLSADGVKMLASAPLSTYLLDHDATGTAAVFHSMSDPSVSSARGDAPRYGGPSTIRSTVEGGNAVFLSKKDLDDLQAGNVSQTITFAATKDGSAWLASPNAALYNVRVRPSIEGMPAAYTSGANDSTATPYGTKIFNDSMPRGYISQTSVNVPMDGVTKYVVTSSSSTNKPMPPIVAAARERGLMVYVSTRDMDSLAGNPAGLAPDFYLVWPGTVMGKDYVRVS